MGKVIGDGWERSLGIDVKSLGIGGKDHWGWVGKVIGIGGSHCG